MKSLKNLLLVTAAFIASVTSTFATNANDFDLPAVGGYDLVSYHQEKGPVRGSGFQASQHEGVTYLFANETNKAAFEANPEKYLPAYNGYCAYGVSVKQKFNTDPSIYEIIDGKLYLNLNKDIQKKWAEDISGNIEKADTNWKKIK